jgi:hypothetical protein
LHIDIYHGISFHAQPHASAASASKNSIPRKVIQTARSQKYNHNDNDFRLAAAFILIAAFEMTLMLRSSDFIAFIDAFGQVFMQLILFRYYYMLIKAYYAVSYDDDTDLLTCFALMSA